MKEKLLKLIKSLELTDSMKAKLSEIVKHESVFLMISKSGKRFNICGVDVANKAQMKEYCPDLLSEIEESKHLSYFIGQGDDYETPLLSIGPNSTLTTEDKADLFA